LCYYIHTMTHETNGVMMDSALKRARETFTQLTQTDVAGALGISLSAYQKWEQGARSISAQQVVRLSRILGVSTDTILGTAFSELDADEECELGAMTSDEVSLLRSYRSLDPVRRDVVLVMVTALAESVAG